MEAVAWFIAALGAVAVFVGPLLFIFLLPSSGGNKGEAVTMPPQIF